MKRMAGAGAAAMLAAASLAGCGSTNEGATSDASPGRTKVTVFAAASLKNTFESFEKEFEAKNPDIDVVFTFAGSQDLVTQMDGGAPADVFASASKKWMDTAESKNLVSSSPRIFARNSLEIAVAEGNPKKVTGLDDLASRPELVVVRCASEVPCGALTDKVLMAAGDPKIDFDTEQNSVTDTLGLVKAGEVDVAFVYETDVASAPEKVDGLEIPEAESLANEYPIAVTVEAQKAKRSEAAQKFVDYVLGDDGQKALAEAGFQKGE